MERLYTSYNDTCSILKQTRNKASIVSPFDTLFYQQLQSKQGFTDRDKVSWVNIDGFSTTEISLNSNIKVPEDKHTQTDTQTPFKVSASNPCFRQAVFAEDEKVCCLAGGISIAAQMHSPLPPLFLYLSPPFFFSTFLTYLCCSVYTLHQTEVRKGDKMEERATRERLCLEYYFISRSQVN